MAAGGSDACIKPIDQFFKYELYVMQSAGSKMDLIPPLR
jgi:hypothetical protein